MFWCQLFKPEGNWFKLVTMGWAFGTPSNRPRLFVCVCMRLMFPGVFACDSTVGGGPILGWFADPWLVMRVFFVVSL